MKPGLTGWSPRSSTSMCRGMVKSSWIDYVIGREERRQRPENSELQNPRTQVAGMRGSKVRGAIKVRQMQKLTEAKSEPGSKVSGFPASSA